MSEELNKKDHLTTTEAARLLSVSPDTVLKWVKAGKIKSYRTFGGHYRIPQSALGLTDTKQSRLVKPETMAATQDFEYCWEYMADGGEVKQDCLDCITYRSRSRRCYELRDLPEGLGCLRVYCKSTCEDCEYFQIVQEQDLNVLIYGNPGKLIKDYDKLELLTGYQFQFVKNEYDCASKIEKFRPDFVVVDCTIGKKRTANLCRNLFNDNRIPVTRIILASRAKKLTDYCDKEVFGWITRPFSVLQLRDCLTGTNLIHKL